MRSRTTAAIVCGAHFCLWLGSSLAQPPGTPLPAGIRGGSELVPEARVEIRTYRFDETGEELPYSVFVSSKIEPGEKAPLHHRAARLHRDDADFRARHDGRSRRGRRLHPGRTDRLQQPRGLRRSGPTAPRAARVTVGSTPRGGAQTADARPAPPIVGGTAETDPARVTEYSEKDVMNVPQRWCGRSSPSTTGVSI